MLLLSGTPHGADSDVCVRRDTALLRCSVHKRVLCNGRARSVLGQSTLSPAHPRSCLSPCGCPGNGAAASVHARACRRRVSRLGPLGALRGPADRIGALDRVGVDFCVIQVCRADRGPCVPRKDPSCVSPRRSRPRAVAGHSATGGREPSALPCLLRPSGLFPGARSPAISLCRCDFSRDRVERVAKFGGFACSR